MFWLISRLYIFFLGSGLNRKIYLNSVFLIGSIIFLSKYLINSIFKFIILKNTKRWVLKILNVKHIAVVYYYRLLLTTFASNWCRRQFITNISSNEQKVWSSYRGIIVINRSSSTITNLLQYSSRMIIAFNLHTVSYCYYH